MIVRRADQGSQLLITQPAHAHLARRVMEECVLLGDHPRRTAILHAIAEHDSGWQEEDAAPEFDAAGTGVVDFIHIPVPVLHRVWLRSVAKLAGEPWAAALVAHHTITVYDRYRGEPQWESFFAGMEVSRDAMLARSDTSAAHLTADYVFLRLGDLISLCFCTGVPDEQRIGEWRVQWVDPSVLVAPDPFGGREISMGITATEIHVSEIRSSRDLREAVEGGRTVTLEGRVAARAAGAP
jgi:hypothetical protein